MCAALLIIFSGLSRIVNCTWISQPKTNVWLTLANATNQRTLRVAMTSPSDPFRTCLIGIPLTEREWDQLYNHTVTRNCKAPGKRELLWWCLEKWQSSAGWPAGWYWSNDSGNGMSLVDNFPALPLQPQKLELLGSIQATACFFLNYSRGLNINKTGIKISGTGIYLNNSAWCNFTTPLPFTTGTDAGGHPDNIFLICGDRAWKGIPGKAVGGPWTFGRLTMFHRSTQAIVNWTLQHRQSRRAAVQFDSDCNSHITFWNHAQRFLVL